jgi:hypothetical protein
MRRAVALALLVAAPSSASADRRRFAATYEYPTLLEGQTSLELSHTQTRAAWGDEQDRLDQAFEVEHGLTERWDAGLALGFSQRGAAPLAPAQPYGFEQLRLETRYRFADRNEWPIDLAVLARGATYFSASAYATEARVIAARDMDALSVAANVIGAIQFGDDAGDTNVQLGWAAGVTYELHPKLNLGVETSGVRNLTNEKLTLGSVGPVIALAPSGQLWLTLSAAFGFADGPDIAAHLLLGIEL